MRPVNQPSMFDNSIVASKRFNPVQTSEKAVSTKALYTIVSSEEEQLKDPIKKLPAQIEKIV